MARASHRPSLSTQSTASPGASPFFVFESCGGHPARDANLLASETYFGEPVSWSNGEITPLDYGEGDASDEPKLNIRYKRRRKRGNCAMCGGRRAEGESGAEREQIQCIMLRTESTRAHTCLARYGAQSGNPEVTMPIRVAPDEGVAGRKGEIGERDKSGTAGASGERGGERQCLALHAEPFDLISEYVLDVEIIIARPFRTAL